MKKILLLLFAIGLFQQAKAQTVTCIVGASPFQDSIWALDTTSGYLVTRRFSPNALSGGSITGITGMTKNPNSGSVYVICKQSATTGRTLGKLDLATGNVTIIGNLGDNFSSITFRGDSLFAATGDGATTPETLFLVDTLTAGTTLLTAMGAGADGEVICYNPFDDMIYHWSGNGTVIFEKILPYPPFTITDIPTTGTSGGETFGALNISATKFIRSTISSNFNYQSVSGTYSATFGANPDDLRGLILINCDRTLSGPSTVCTGSTITVSAPLANGYQWYKNGIALSGETNQTLNVSSAGNYNCIISDNCGADSTNALIITENPLPVVILTVGDSVICSGESTLLSGTSGSSYQWYSNGTLIPGATSNTYSATTSGMYNMAMTDANGCTDSSFNAIEIVVNSLPNVVLTAASDSVCSYGVIVTLTTSPTGGTLTGTGVSGANFDPTIASLGNNTVTYTYTDSNGCTNSDSVVINVDPCSSTQDILTQDIFSVYPNPANNYIVIESSLKLMEVRIIDLTGKTVLGQKENATLINLNDIANGIYTLIVKDINNQDHAIKFIKQ